MIDIIIGLIVAKYICDKDEKKAQRKKDKTAMDECVIPEAGPDTVTYLKPGEGIEDLR